MRIAITGESGFIGSNLPRSIKKQGHTFVSLNEVVHTYTGQLKTTAKGEPCVHRTNQDQWELLLSNEKVDVLIHNAAVVGTDVVALDSKEATLTNVEGTYNICRAARSLGIPVCYMGTTVIYDTKQYQSTPIAEESTRGPTTLYGCQKLCAEDIVKSQADKWMIVRPLFAYGGEGDMNSLIAKTIYAVLNGEENIDMFLDPTKIKDYMHVYDYCDAVVHAIDKGLWYQDWNVAAENSLMTSEIVELIEKVIGRSLENVIQWHPKTDYLGNHMLTSWKFRKCSDWTPQIDLETGIKMSYESILKSKGYNPLKYLEKARANNIDLTEFYG